MAARLSYSSIPNEIKQIANDSLGVGVLKSLFSYSNTYHLMIKISDGEFVGFALYHFQSTRLKNGEDYITGIIDCVCVAPAYRQEGFGTLLIFGVLRKMSAFGADRIEAILKSPTYEDRDGEPGIPFQGSGELLTSMGFRKTKVYENYFKQKSLKYGYDCKFCGNTPDSCRAILYSINE